MSASRISLNTVSGNVLLTRFYESLSYRITMTEPVRGKTYEAHTWIKTLRP